MFLNSRVFCQFFLVLSLFLSSSALSTTLSLSNYQLVLPPDVEVNWILKDGVHNGVKSSIVSISFGQSYDKVLSHFRDELARYGKYNEAVSSDGMTVLSQQRRNEFISFQLKESHSVVMGALTVSEDYLTMKTMNSKFIQVPVDMSIVTVLADKMSEVLTMVSRQPIDTVNLQLKAAFSRSGWQLRLDVSNVDSKGHSLVFAKGSSIARLFIANDPSWNKNTLIYVNTMIQ